MKKVDETKQFFVFDEANEPALHVNSGDRVEFTCQDCWQNLLVDESVKKSDLLKKGILVNPINGPVYIEGAMPGDTIKVHIEDIHVTGNSGAMAFDPKEQGILGQFFDQEETVRVPIKDGVAEFFGGRVKLPIRPMIGVISTSPAGKGISAMAGGHCGGNMDLKHLMAGTSIYLPVEVPGALLGIGDLHGLQGDGEVPAALEVTGNVIVTVEVIKEQKEEWPVLETDDAWYMIATEDNMTDACFKATEAMAKFMIKRGGEYSKLEWMEMLGMVGDLEVCQIPNPRMTARYRMPKEFAAGIQF